MKLLPLIKLSSIDDINFHLNFVFETNGINYLKLLKRKKIDFDKVYVDELPYWQLHHTITEYDLWDNVDFVLVEKEVNLLCYIDGENDIFVAKVRAFQDLTDGTIYLLVR